MNKVHILNGDALKERFPSSIDGELIVARECLVDGDVSADSLEELFELRASYLDTPNASDEQLYRNKVVPEFKKIINLPDKTHINLWFEDDLFCQVNLWFVSHLIEKFVGSATVFLVRPHTNLQYGFGGLDTEGLVQAHQARIQLSPQDFKLFASFWKLYQDQKHTKILNLSKKNVKKFPFLETAAHANLERFPSNGFLGRPEKSLLEIMNELGSAKFGLVFQEFHKRESIYGFGDLQVKKMFDELRNR